MKRNPMARHSRPPALPIIFILALLGLVACSSTTDPTIGPGDLSFQFSPEQSVLSIYPGQLQEFAITSEPQVGLGMNWFLNGAAMGDSAQFHYLADYVGVDTLRAVYSFQGTQWSRIWYLDVNENPSTSPPAVPGIVLSHGVSAASVRVQWQWVNNSEFPVEEYVVALSYDGPITALNWEEARVLGSLPHEPEQVGYSLTFYEDPDGLEPGRDAWFIVRGRDSVGQLSEITEEYHIQISRPWVLEGYVFDDAMNPIPEVIIDYGCPSCRVNTDANGHFSLGPVPDVAVLTLSTLSRDLPEPGDPLGSWYDRTWPDVTFTDGGNYDIILPRRLGLADGCDVFDWEFLSFFRSVTRTDHLTDLRPNMNLYHWREYPISVYVQPGYVSDAGLDMTALVSEAVGFWNIAMGDDYFVLTDDLAAADLDIYFGYESAYYVGRAFITAPDDEDYINGDVIPEHMKVFLSDHIAVPLRLQEVAMHELGHVLGLHNHNLCSGSGFLMSISPEGALENGPQNAVHEDERRAVRLIRNLRQGTDMSSFEDH